MNREAETLRLISNITMLRLCGMVIKRRSSKGAASAVLDGYRATGEFIDGEFVVRIRKE